MIVCNIIIECELSFISFLDRFQTFLAKKCLNYSYIEINTRKVKFKYEMGRFNRLKVVTISNISRFHATYTVY